MDKASVSSMLFLFLLGTIEKSIAIHDGVISTEATTVQTVDKTNKSLRGDLLPIAKSKSKSQRNHYQRVLQSLNLYERPFVLAGVPLYANIALEQCVDEWMPFVACVTTDCPNVTERCSPNIFYDHGASNYGSNTPKIMDGTLSITTAAWKSITTAAWKLVQILDFRFFLSYLSSLQQSRSLLSLFFHSGNRTSQLHHC